MEMLAVGPVDRLPVLQALEHHEGGVQERHRKQDQRQHERDHRRRLHGGLDGDHTHQQPEQLCAAVTHEARCGREVVEQEPQRRPGCEGSEHTGLLTPEVEGDDRHGRGDDHADAGCQSVDAIGEVDHVHHQHETDDGEHRTRVGDPGVGEREPPDERQRDHLDRDPEVHNDHGGEQLSDELDPWSEIEAVVERANHRDHTRAQQHAVPQLMLFEVAGRQPDQRGDECAGEDRHPAQQWGRALRQPPLAWFVDRADLPRDAHGERSEQRGHRRREEERVQRVELVRMRHELAHSIACPEVASVAARSASLTC
jgi:hypothetical protein